MSDAAQTVVGSVVALWRYPIKSMMGEELNAAQITQRGLLSRRPYHGRCRLTFAETRLCRLPHIPLDLEH